MGRFVRFISVAALCFSISIHPPNGMADFPQMPESGSYKTPCVSLPCEKAVNESARRIQVAYDVDVVVVGGTSGGVAAAMVIEELGDAAAAKPRISGELLEKPGIIGHAFTDIEQARRRTPASATDTKTRNASLRELFLAAALYRCGDCQGLGEKILREYSRDLRAHYACHARAVLREKWRQGWKETVLTKYKTELLIQVLVFSIMVD